MYIIQSMEKLLKKYGIIFYLIFHNILLFNTYELG